MRVEPGREQLLKDAEYDALYGLGVAVEPGEFQNGKLPGAAGPTYLTPAQAGRGIGVAVEPDEFQNMQLPRAAGPTYRTPAEAGRELEAVDGLGFEFPKIDFGKMLSNTVNSLMQNVAEVGANVLGDLAEKELKEALGIKEGQTTTIVTRTATAPMPPSPQTPAPISPEASQVEIINIPPRTSGQQTADIMKWAIPIGVGALALVGVIAFAGKKRR